jgi:hypothetical protein
VADERAFLHGNSSVCCWQVCFLWAGATAGKAYIWHDKDGNVHFSDRPPQPDETGGDIEEREFKEAPKPEPKPIAISDNPIEHAVKAPFG